MTSPTQSSLSLEILDGNIALLTLDQPGSRANTLGQAVLGDFETMVRQLAARTDLRGLILRSGKPGMFIAGADLKELGSAKGDPTLTRKLIARGLGIVAAYENLPFPTVACVDGACAGGGLELILGFDYRLASTNPKTEIGLPEVKIGLIPGWGGTQRLTRLIGPSLAAEMICAGELARTDKARQLGIVFDVVPVERLVDEARRLLEWARTSSDWEKGRQRKRQPIGLSEEQYSFAYAAAKAVIVAKAGPHYPAPPAALDAIFKGANLPLDEGLKVETEAFAPLVGSRESLNLIAVFFMTQRLQKDPGITDASIKPRDIRQAGIVGAGIMGAGIAGAHVRRGIPALLIDSVPAALERGVTNLTTSMAGRVEIGRMTPAEMAGALARLSTSLALPALGDRDLVVEAIVENEEVKNQLFATIEKLLPPGAILTSNTSTIPISRMAQPLKYPDRFAGLHFFNPVERMQLVEVIRGDKTSDATVATLVAHVKKLGKTPVVVRDCPGFLVNRILFPYMNEAIVLLEEGASPRDVDKAATAFGMPMGPITLQDVVGLDTSLHAGKVMQEAFADRGVTTSLIAELVKAGRLGQKSGSGFYAYPKGPKGVDDPALAAFLSKVRRTTRTITPEEITDRLFLPMLTEASRVLAEDIVRDPADVDMGLILGIGFPPFRGGLLRWADSVGLPQLLSKLEKYASLGKRFEPTEKLRQLAAQSKGFYADAN